MQPHPTLPPLILASQSPRRRELMAEAGYQFSVIVPHDSAEDDARPGESPAQLVQRLAVQKAGDVAGKLGGAEAVVIGCDTVVECGGKILGKPADRTDARRMLDALCGQEHHVLSGLCLWKTPGGERLVRLALTRLRMDALSPEAIEEYLESGQWEGKAGAFGYQDRLGWIHIIEGSESNVVGLPMELLAEMLEEL